MKENPSTQAQYSSELKQKVEAIIKSRELLKQQNEELELRLLDMQTQLDGLRAQQSSNISSASGAEEIDTLNAQLAVMGDENNSLTQQMASLRRELEQQREKNRQLEDQKGQVTEEAMAKHLGNLLVEAKNTAQRVVTEAQESVLAVKTEAADISLKVANELARLKKEIEDMRSSVSGVIEGFNNKLDVLDRMVDTAGSSLVQYQRKK